jgi:isocitrate dehydrogenase kinase/phosphatase
MASPSIKGDYLPQKDTTREQSQGKYLLFKQHDRVGRMADTLGYSEAAFPRRFRRVPAPRNEEDEMDAAFWQGHKDRLLVGHVLDVFPYDRDKRFAPAGRVAERFMA